MHLSVRFSTEKELKQFQDLLYEKSGQGVSFTGLLEAMVSEATIVTAVHNIKSNKGSKTAGVDRMKMDKYLQMPKEELFQLIQSNISNYKPKPAKRKYIEKANGKKRPLGIPTVLDRIIQECMRLILEPICEARFYPHSYGFRPYRAQKHAIRDIVNVINASVKWRANFEYFMNREYAYNRDKGKCKCCGRYFSELIPKHCHHVNPRLPIERINKVPNLAWLCISIRGGM